jgi:hypothetical protein
MRTSLLALAAVLIGALAASACDYNRVAVSNVVVTQAVPVVQTFAVPSYQAVAVVPTVQSFAVVKQQVIVANHGYAGFQTYGGFGNNGFRRNGFNGGFRGNGFRQQNAGGTGVVGLARGVVNTAGNVLGAVIGR